MRRYHRGAERRPSADIADFAEMLVVSTPGGRHRCGPTGAARRSAAAMLLFGGPAGGEGLAWIAAIAIAPHRRAVGDGDGALVEQGAAMHAGGIHRGDEIVVDAVGRELCRGTGLEAEDLVAAG